MSDFRMIHLADIHLGYTGSVSLVFGEGEKFAGRYVREVDIEQAVDRLTSQIVAAEPPVDVAVITGDLFHRSAPLPRAIRTAARMVNGVVRQGIDVVIIDGNHETSSWRHTGSPTSFLREIGAHVVNGQHHKVIPNTAWRNRRLQQGELAIHALPYRAVLAADFTGAMPLDGRINVLLTHGRVQGMADLNSLGIGAARIPPEVLRRQWDYIALGDWHTHRYQPLLHVPAYYAGSLEALNFGEAVYYPPRQDDGYAVHGVLDVRLTVGKEATVHTIENTNRRPVLRLRPIEAAEMEPEALMRALHQRLEAGLPEEALVLLEVKECPASVWERLDHVEIERLRKRARRCDIRWEISQPNLAASDEALSEASLDDQWQDFLQWQMSDDAECNWFLQEGRSRIESARELLQVVHLDAGEE